jgi:hypothetical protein
VTSAAPWSAFPSRIGDSDCELDDDDDVDEEVAGEARRSEA